MLTVRMRWFSAYLQWRDAPHDKACLPTAFHSTDSPFFVAADHLSFACVDVEEGEHD